MQQEIQLNIIPFTAPVEEAEFAFYTAKQYSYCPKLEVAFPGTIIDFVDQSIHNSSAHLIDQVYQFSRMYWKSVKQQNLPVTIKYPEMVAQIFPYFESKTIPV